MSTSSKISASDLQLSVHGAITEILADLLADEDSDPSEADLEVAAEITDILFDNLMFTVSGFANGRVQCEVTLPVQQ